ncbi:zinc ribbon domain-containing protein [Rubinisphaera italica]|uniref:Putative zinc ribbon domain protein n=1 Tax=Rubinisphaera italica TaxID=2527969 RepID=A0A5C5XCU3_9PLAN|nr:C4-type zinc ribbon domain-containing protein [Rubinisphaera italica]TWT60211.1 putative zinc ribbon domain protein [Rubinisphaera italica]
MTSATNSLKELHQVLLQLEDCRSQLERGPSQIKARENIVRKREAEQVEFLDRLKHLRMSADSKSLELKTVEKKIEDLKGKLNSASSNREFDIFKAQIKADEMAMSVLEDEILEAFDQTETESNRKSEFEENVKSAKQQLADFKSKFDSDSIKNNEIIARLEEELKVLEKDLPKEPAEQYRRLVNSRGAKSMAAVLNGACGNCYVNLTPQQRIQIKSGPVQFCSNCGSILYIDENPEAD